MPEVRKGAADGREPTRGLQPIYDRLAAQWRAEGRIVPGQVDGEWLRAAAMPHAADGTGFPGRGWMRRSHG